MNDTIIARATAAGHSLQAIIRLSGPDSLPLVQTVFQPATGRRNHFNKLSYHSVAGQIILSSPRLTLPGTLYIMKSPRSYTREDVVEIHTLGVPALLETVLQYFLRRGARLAEPGEFTRRAFLNGRIDLAQAESVLNIIRARSERELTLANRQLTGHLSERLNKLKESLRNLLAQLELALDFSDQDVPILPETTLHRHLRGLMTEINSFLDSRDRMLVFRESISVVLCGRPNVGKSSLFNRLLAARHAIVTPIAGTTRDVLEADLILGGQRLRLCDTAGLGAFSGTDLHRATRRQTQSALENADIFLLVLDGSQPLTAADRRLFRKLPPEHTIVIINKNDLPQKITPKRLKQAFKGIIALCPASARTGQGLREIRQTLQRAVAGLRVDKSSSPYLINTRMRAGLESAVQRLQSARTCLPPRRGRQETTAPELAALEVRSALQELETTLPMPDNQNVGNDILNRIFGQFCIGK